ncbi:MAG: hypothetical protein ABII64_06845 [Elusimicrobiota bacterium]
MILLTTNQVVGWGGVAFCAYLAKKTGKKVFIAWGTAVYVLSWGMLLLGAYLAGKEGLELSKQLLAKYGWWVLAAALTAISVIIYVKKVYPVRDKTKPVISDKEIQ